MYGEENNIDIGFKAMIKNDGHLRDKASASSKSESELGEQKTDSDADLYVATVVIWILCFLEVLAISHLINNDRKTGVRKVLMMMGLQVITTA